MKKKTENRKKFIERIINYIIDQKIWDKIRYKSENERTIKTYLRSKLEDKLKDYFMEQGYSVNKAKQKVSEILITESDPTTIVNNIQFFGVQHRPDFIIKFNDVKIALEIKKGTNGQSIREGIGQSIVYVMSEEYDFVIYLFLDVTKLGTIKKGAKKPKEQELINKLWDQFNIVVKVI